MKTWFVQALATALAIASGVAFAEERIALVVGNAKYASSPLRNSVNDAVAIAERLRSLGFAVDLRTDVSQRDLTRAISQFGTRLAPGSVGLFYFAGHGMQVKGRNFLIPIDAEIISEASVRSEAVDLDLLLEQLGPARLSMVILDACRNNPFEGKFRGARGSGLAQIDAPKGTLIAYATAPGKVAADGLGDNGVYTSALLNALDTPGLKVEDVFKRVRVNVAGATVNLQVPWESSSLTGDFYFRPEVRAEPSLGPDFQKALQEENARRDREAAALRAELESLRAQVSMLRPPATEAPALRPAPEKQALKDGYPNKAVGGSALSPAETGWAKTRLLLAQNQAGLTFSKAMALLLGAETPEDVDQLLESERTLTGYPHHSAFAMGVSPSGHLSWTAQWRHSLRLHAEEEALAKCHAFLRGEGKCELVMLDGQLIPENLGQIAKQLGKADVPLVRRSFLSRRPKPQDR